MKGFSSLNTRITGLWLLVLTALSTPGLPLAAAEKPSQNFDPGIQALLVRQSEDGAWRARAVPSTPLYNAHLIFLYEYVGQIQLRRTEVRDLVEGIWSKVEPHGGFAPFAGGPENHSINALAYVATRLAGELEDSPRLSRLQARIQDGGGLSHVDFTAAPYLMLLGLDQRSYCVPQGLFHQAMRRQSRLPWFRVIALPVLYLLSQGEIHEVPADRAPQRLGRIRGCPARRLSPELRASADAQMGAWLDEHLGADGTLFDYSPTTIPALMTLSRLSGTKRVQQLALGLEAVRRFQFRDEGDHLVLSPGEASVAETSVIGSALLDLGVSSDSDSLLRAEAFLRSVQAEDGSFGFSTYNERFPDPNDTATAIQFLRRIEIRARKPLSPRLAAGVRWILERQNHDGGWGAWDSNHELLNWLRPAFSVIHRRGFVIDESITDDTARIVLALDDFKTEMPEVIPSIRRAVRWLKKQQRADGSIPGVWLIRQQFGTAMSLAALGVLPEARGAERTILRGIEFLQRTQNPDGGFGESPQSFWEDTYVPLGSSSPAQTGLVVSQLATLRSLTGSRFAGRIDAIRAKAISYLQATRRADGTWGDPTWTAVSFPKMEFLVYPLLQELQPLRALLWESRGSALR